MSAYQHLKSSLLSLIILRMPSAILCCWSAPFQLLTLSLLFLNFALKFCEGVHCRLRRRLSLSFRQLSVVFA